MDPSYNLSRRERQIMDVLHRLGEATAAQLLEVLPDAPTNSAMRAHLRVLESKGHVVHVERGRAYVYRAATRVAATRRAALKHLVETFFAGSVEAAAAALVELDSGLDDATRRKLLEKISDARRDERAARGATDRKRGASR